MTIPTCHACGSSAVPFAVRIGAGCWRHSCGALVCPACGGVPADGDTLCGACRGLVGALPIQPGDVIRVTGLSSINEGSMGTLTAGTITGWPVVRGRRRRGR